MLTSQPEIVPVGPPRPERQALLRLACVLVLGLSAGAAALYAVPRGVEAGISLAIEDDPSQIADHALDSRFSTETASREIETALSSGDADLARSFVELSRDRGLPLDPALTSKVDKAVAESESAGHAVENFAMGFVTGEPNDASSFAGTTVGDLFVFGDIRDAVREGGRLALGQPADQLVLGLAAVGLAVTAGTYATLGSAAPVRVGVSLAKAARKTGKLSADLAAYTGRALRQVVDWNKLKTAMTGGSIAQPLLALRAAREAVKVEHAGGILNLVRDVGRVQNKAGTRAALDGLKVAGSPREMSRLARLAEKKGGKTRAILKVAGRGAIALTFAALDLGLWILGAIIAVLTFVASLKSTTERIALRFIRRRKKNRAGRFAALALRG